MDQDVAGSIVERAEPELVGSADVEEHRTDSGSVSGFTDSAADRSPGIRPDEVVGWF